MFRGDRFHNRFKITSKYFHCDVWPQSPPPAVQMLWSILLPCYCHLTSTLSPLLIGQLLDCPVESPSVNDSLLWLLLPQGHRLFNFSISSSSGQQWSSAPELCLRADLSLRGGCSQGVAGKGRLKIKTFSLGKLKELANIPSGGGNATAWYAFLHIFAHLYFPHFWPFLEKAHFPHFFAHFFILEDNFRIFRSKTRLQQGGKVCVSNLTYPTSGLGQPSLYSGRRPDFFYILLPNNFFQAQLAQPPLHQPRKSSSSQSSGAQAKTYLAK